jgi:GNAT superfamily N-acetyltransferase
MPMEKREIEIRDMNENDLDDVLEIIARHDDDDVDAAEAYFEVTFEEGGGTDGSDRHFVAVDEGLIVGVGGVMLDAEEGEDIWWLGWFYVDPESQHHGIGQALLDRSLAWARGQGGRKVYVDVSDFASYANARSFYAKNGFVEEGRLIDFYADGEACVIMGRKL